MLRNSRLPTLAALALILIAGGIAAWAVASDVRAVTTAGTSMEPRYRAGDLVLTRSARNYRVGDVVAFRNREVGGPLTLHRIVASENGRFTTKGDNKLAADPLPIDESEITGVSWVHLPRAGAVLAWIREPSHIALISGIIVALAGAVGAVNEARQRRLRGAVVSPATAFFVQSRLHDGVVLAGRLLRPVAVLAVVGVAATYWGFNRDLRSPQPTTVGYTQQDGLSYTARSSSPAVYAGGAAVTGQPVFRKAAGPVELRYTYRLTPERGAEQRGATLLSGSARILLRVANGTGWQRDVTLVQRARFRNGKVELRAVLPVERLERLSARAGAATGLQGSDLTVIVVPEVTVKAVLAGRPFSTRFGTPANFTIGKDVIRLNAPQQGLRVGAPLGNQISGSVVGPDRFVTAHANVLGRKVAISSLRYAGIGMLFFAAGLGILALVASASTLLLREPSRLRLLYRAWLVPVMEIPVEGSRVVPVESFGALRQISQSYGRMILHETREGESRYAVSVEGDLHLYVSRSAARS